MNNEVATPEEVQQFLSPNVPQGTWDQSEVATPQEAEQWLYEQERAEKYGTLPQQVLTGLEGAASAATFGLSTGLQTALGVAPEDIQARREENPAAYTTGQIAGFAASMAVPGGAGAIATKAGQTAAKALGVASELTAASKIGSQATKFAVENMLMTSGDEVSKMFSDSAPPGEAAQTALINVGLSGLIGAGTGGVFGSISPLWKSTAGPKVEKILSSFKDKMGGLATQMPEDLSKAILDSGMELPPDIMAAMTGSSIAKREWNILQNTNTSYGLKAQENFKKFQTEIADKAVEAFGKRPEFIERLNNLSDYETGANVVDKISTSLKKQAEPVIQEFQKIRKEFSKVALSEESDILADRLALLAEEQYGSYRLGDDYKFVQKQIENLPNIRDLEGLRQVQSGLWNEAKSGKASWDAVGKVVGLMREIEGDTLLKAAGSQGEDAVMRVQLARSAYGDLAQELQELNKFLKIKGWKGPDSFLEALSEAGEEGILRKLTREDSVRLTQFLNNRFPEAAQDIRDYQINVLLKESAKGAKEGQVINTTRLFKEIDSLSPELRENLITPEQMQKLQAVKALKDALPDRPINPSGTAKTLDAIWGQVPGSAAGMATLLMSGSPVAGMLVGGLTGFLGRDVPDATRMALLKYIGSGGNIEPGAFKAVVDYVNNAAKGEMRLNQSTKNIFKSGAEVLSTKLIPDRDDRKKLDKKVQNLSLNPQELMNIGGDVGQLLPNQTTGLSQTAMNAVNFLNSLRPVIVKNAPLDPEYPVDEFQQSKYDRALDIAQQPLLVMKDIKSGTLTIDDVRAIQNMYPDLYSRLQVKLVDEMNNAISDGVRIPYETRMGLSLFLGQPLDSTMTPQSIMSIQSKNMFVQQQQQMQNMPKGSLKDLSKLPSSHQTPEQARIMRKNRA